MRELATIRVIDEVHPIPGADRIELVYIGGWQCVVKKDEFQAGDHCVYFEIDSVLPEEEWSEFMRPRKFRVKTIRLRKTLSQGLALPEAAVGITPAYFTPGTDVTERLGVTLYEPGGSKDPTAGTPDSGVKCKWLLRFSLGRKLHGLLWPRKKGGWPVGIPKTDENRIQNMVNFRLFQRQSQVYKTEKLHGQSGTFFYDRRMKTGVFKKGYYGVCSRNVWLKVPSGSWGYISEKLHLEERLSSYCETWGKSLAIQGEIVGEGIEGNHYKLNDRFFYVFNVWDIEGQRYLSLSEKRYVLRDIGLVPVPYLGMLDVNLFNEEPKDVRKLLLDDAEDLSLLANVEREGVVYRSALDDSISFKAISNRWLLKCED